MNFKKLKEMQQKLNQSAELLNKEMDQNVIADIHIGIDGQVSSVKSNAIVADLIGKEILVRKSFDADTDREVALYFVDGDVTD